MLPSPPPERPETPRDAAATEASGDRWLFLISGTALLLALLLAIGRERGWGEPRVSVRLLAERADGIRPGMDVRISGLSVGRVRSMELLPDSRVSVLLWVAERHRPLLGPASRARRGQDGLVGEGYLSLSPDPRPSGDRAAGDLRLAYEPPPDLGSLLDGVAETRRTLQSTLRQTSRLMEGEVPRSLGALRGSMGDLSRSMEGVSAMSGSLERDVGRTSQSVLSLRDTLGGEVRRTAPTLRRTLEQADRTAVSADRAAQEARQLLQETRPLLVDTLRQTRSLTTLVNRLLGGLAALELRESSPAPTRREPPSPPGGPRPLEGGGVRIEAR